MFRRPGKLSAFVSSRVAHFDACPIVLRTFNYIIPNKWPNISLGLLKAGTQNLWGARVQLRDMPMMLVRCCERMSAAEERWSLLMLSMDYAGPLV